MEMTSVDRPTPPDTGEVSEPDPAAIALRNRTSSEWGAWLLAFIAFLLPIAAWSLATPQYGSPDEVAHTYRAVSVVRGEILPAADEAYGGGAGVVHVPRSFAENAQQVGCYAFDGSLTADCLVPVAGDDQLVEVTSGAARYNPVYYAMVGWPSLVSTDSAGFYGMRLMSAVLGAAFLASALRSALAGPGRRVWALCLLSFVTPMAFFMAGMINPNGLEICAAASAWVGLLRLSTGSFQPSDRARLVRRVGIASSAMVLTRGLSPLWLAIIAGICLCAMYWPSVKRVFGQLHTWVWVGIIGVATTCSVGWTLYAGTDQIPDLYTEPDKTFIGAITAEWAFMPRRLPEFVGFFGWTDTPPPAFAVALCGMLMGATIITGLLTADRRRLVAICGLFALVLIVPLVLEAIQFNDLGLFWQSRYTLPIAVGLGPLCAAAVTTRLHPSDRTSFSTTSSLRRGVFVIGAIFVVVHQLCFNTALGRYAIGLNESLNPFDGDWSPPGGKLLVLLLHFVGVCGVVALVWQSSRRAPSAARDTPDYATRPSSEPSESTEHAPVD